MRIVAAGGRGFIGRHVVGLLTTSEHDVVTVDRRPLEAPMARETFLHADLSDPTVSPVLAASCGEVDAVVWLAASIRHRDTVDETAGEDVSVMVETPLRFLDSLARPPASFVYLSSLQVYGTPESLPISEEHPTRPFTAYGVAKLAAEAYLRVACRARRTALAVLRLAFVYGPGQHPSNALPRFLDAVRTGEPPRIRGDGQEVRDDVYVGDVARAVLAAVEQRADGTMNIGSGRPNTLLDLAEAACRLADTPLRPIRTPERSRWIGRWLDVSRARERLGWSPGTLLDRGIAEMWGSP